jgi:hypothetical protein
MSKTTALTFVAAIVLFAACIVIGDYGARSVAQQRYAAEGATPFMMFDEFDTELESWERASGLMGLMALSVLVAGTILWVRDEEPPHSKRVSILRLDERPPRQILTAPAPYNSAAGARARFDEGGAQPQHEMESLTPLERVIRGY